jgi:L-rhamnose mutarotase
VPQDKTRLDNLTSQIKEEIKQLKNDTISEFLRELTSDSITEYSLWKTTKNVKRPIMEIPPIKNMDGSWARINEQKPLRFAEHLENIFQPNTTESTEVLPDVI